MIVKKIPARRDSRHGGSRRAKHVRNLVDYMRSPDKDDDLKEYLVAYMASAGLDHGPERLLHIGARNFVCDGLDEQRAEMMAVAQAAVRSANPVDHWLLSWREGEFPSVRQVDEAVEMFVDELGLAQHQCIYALHGDTHNRHVHIALNRYNQETGKVQTINKGFFLEAAHKAVARIVDRFGWQPEAEARYVMAFGQPILSAPARKKMENGRRPLLLGAAAYEVRTGYRSAQRIAQEEALPILSQASTWADVHAALAARGITYEKKGSNGAVISVGDDNVNASNVSRNITITRLQKRLGEYEPRDPAILVVERDGGTDRFPDAFRADEYRKEVTRWQKASPEQRKSLRLRRPPSDLETWLHLANEHAAAEGWRHRKFSLDEMDAIVADYPLRGDIQQEVEGFRPHRCASGIRYARENSGSAFVECENRIVIIPALAAVAKSRPIAACGEPGREATAKGVGWRESDSLLGGGFLVGLDDDSVQGSVAGSGSHPSSNVAQLITTHAVDADVGYTFLRPGRPARRDDVILGALKLAISKSGCEVRFHGSEAFRQQALEVAKRNDLVHHVDQSSVAVESREPRKERRLAPVTPVSERADASRRRVAREAAAAMSGLRHGPADVRGSATTKPSNTELSGRSVTGVRPPQGSQPPTASPNMSGNSLRDVDKSDPASNLSSGSMGEASAAKRAAAKAALRRYSKGPSDVSSGQINQRARGGNER